MNVGPSRPGASASQSLDQVLGQSGPMSLLLGALQTSARYWACAQEALPPALRAHVRCGPVLDQRWSLFVPNGAVASKLKQMGLDSVLLITDTFDENLHLATRNLQSIAIVEPEYADPVSLVYFDRVLITRAALAKVEEMLS